MVDSLFKILRRNVSKPVEMSRCDDFEPVGMLGGDDVESAEVRVRECQHAHADTEAFLKAQVSLALRRRNATLEPLLKPHRTTDYDEEDADADLRLVWKWFQEYQVNDSNGGSCSPFKGYLNELQDKKRLQFPALKEFQDKLESTIVAVVEKSTIKTPTETTTEMAGEEAPLLTQSNKYKEGLINLMQLIIETNRDFKYVMMTCPFRKSHYRLSKDCVDSLERNLGDNNCEQALGISANYLHGELLLTNTSRIVLLNLVVLLSEHNKFSNRSEKTQREKEAARAIKGALDRSHSLCSRFWRRAASPEAHEKEQAYKEWEKQSETLSIFRV